MSKTLFSLFLSLFTMPLIGQIDDLKWSKYLGKQGEKFKDCLLAETDNNSIAVFGLGKRTLKFFEVNAAADLLQEKSFNLPKGSTINAVLPVSDIYLLAGHIKKGQKTYPRLWQLNVSKNQLLTIPTAIKETGSFQDLTFNQQGAVLLTGNTSDKMTVYRYTSHNQQISPFFQWDDTKATGNALIEDAMGDYLVAGFQMIKKQSYLSVWKIDAAGELVEAPYLTNQSKTKALDIIQLNNRDIFVTGSQEKNALTSNLLLKVAPNLDTNESLPIPNNQDATQKLGIKTIQTQPNHLLTVGQFHAFGANTSDIWHSWFPLDNATPLDSVLMESSFDDKATDVLRLANKNYLIAAISGNSDNPSIKISQYESAQNPCNTDLDKINSEGFYFIPNQEKIIQVTDSESSFKGYLLSKMPLKNHYLSLTNQTTASKAITELEMTPSPTLAGQHCYHVKTNLRYRRNQVNDIRLSIDKGRNQLYQQIIPQEYLGEKPNLHLITIGINYKLEHTQQDAKDIDALFRTQEGRLFKRVYSYQLNSDNNTEGKPIVDFIDDFCNNRNILQAVTAKDVILLFVSSHGIIRSTPQGENRFILPAIDYSESNRTTYIDYQSDILDKFKNSPGKKVILIDACKSGGLKGFSAELDSGIKKILDAPEGFVTLSSSQADQYSYESGGAIKNGVFTYAIEEALGSKENLLAIDSNSDKVISIQELFNSLYQRVPVLAKEYSADNAEQVPDLNGNEVLKGLPVFFIN